MDITTGATVRYAFPEPGEELEFFVVREDNGDRLLLESLNPHFDSWRFKPTETVAREDVEAI